MQRAQNAALGDIEKRFLFGDGVGQTIANIAFLTIFLIFPKVTNHLTREARTDRVTTD